MWIPDTIVYEEGGIEPFWLYSGLDGFVYRSEKFPERSVVTKFGNQFALNELSCIFKFKDFDDRGYHIGN